MRAISLMLLLSNVLLSACGLSGRGLPANAIEVTIVYGSEKQTWMDAVVQTFNAAGRKTPEGKPIIVTATPMGSAEALNQIIDGTLRPTVWSPASAILLPVANKRWGDTHSNAVLVDEHAAKLVLSPVVIAIWEPMARVLGWPEQPIGWTDIANLATSGKSWADYDRPEWGAIQFGHTHPEYSNSGIASVLAMAYAAAGKTRGLTLEDIQDPTTADLIERIESNIIHYGESTGFFSTQMFSRGPAYLSAAVLYENLVIEARDTQRYPNLALPVVAIYPSEGTFWSDHPYAILQAPWVDAEHKQAAELFQAFLLDRPQQELALSYGFRPGNVEVRVGAPITRENGVDPQQPQTLLEVPSAEVIDAARAVWVEHKKRVDVMIILDVSGSMQDEQRLEQAKAALKRFVSQLHDQDGFGLTIFSDAATVLSPISPIGPKRQELLERIGGLVPAGGTRLLDTVGEAYSELSAEDPGQRIRSLVVLTDGLDTKSSMSSAELTQLLAQDEAGRSIKVFTIAYGGDADVELLSAVAAASGAKSYLPRPNETGSIEQVYHDIATFF